ncbi:MAG: hypothetical protein WCO26_25570 [Deltaproteobacteria bacterium]
MEIKGILTKVLAVVGTVLVWFPILATVVISVVGSIGDRIFRFDYLMPAELFPVTLVGGGLLMWAALRSRSRRRLIGWGLGVAVGLLVGGQVLAVATGLASGETELVGWLWALVVVSIVVYSLALLEIGTAGVLLVCDLFRHGKKHTSSPDSSVISEEKSN